MGTPAHPDYVYPEAPATLTGPGPTLRLERGWQFLQAGDPEAAQREFEAALEAEPRFYPADAGLAYARLAAGDPAGRRGGGSTGRWHRTPGTSRRWSAGVTRCWRSAGRPRRPRAYEAALAAKPDLGDVRRRLDDLAFRSQQAALQSARQAAAGGRHADAAQAYERAIASSPDSAFLYRELAVVERRQGDRTRALEHLRRAADLDPGDRQAWLFIGDLLDEARDFAGGGGRLRGGGRTRCGQRRGRTPRDRPPRPGAVAPARASTREIAEEPHRSRAGSSPR